MLLPVVVPGQTLEQVVKDLVICEDVRAKLDGQIAWDDNDTTAIHPSYWYGLGHIVDQLVGLRACRDQTSVLVGCKGHMYCQRSTRI